MHSPPPEHPATDRPADAPVEDRDAGVLAELSPTEAPVSLSVTVLAAATAAGVLAARLATGSGGTWFDLPLGVWAFLLVWAGTTGYLSFQSVPSGVIGRGFVVAAVLVAADPALTFGAALVGGDRTGIVAAAGDVFPWGLAAVVVAGLLLVVGRRLSRRALRLEHHETRRRVTWGR